jgi:hypothetical protein
MSEISKERARAAKVAVQTFYSFREDLADSDVVRETANEILSTVRRAKAGGRDPTPEEWVDLAEMVDATCDDEGMPRLFEKVDA